jgi:hypothetical protein
VHRDVPREPVPRGEEGRQVGRGHTLQAAAVPGGVRDAEEGVHQERVEELLAELPVPQPVLAVAVGAEREGVDEDGRRPPELHVVGGGVAQREAGGEGLEVEVEVEEGRGLERREGPLVGPRHEREARVLEDDRRVEAEPGRFVRVEPPVGNEAPFGGEAVVEARRGHRLEVGGRPAGDGPEDAPADDVDAAGRVAERPRVLLRRRHCGRFSSSAPPASGRRATSGASSRA